MNIVEPFINHHWRTKKWFEALDFYRRGVFYLLLVSLLIACNSGSPNFTPTPSPPPLAEELVLYNWVEDIPQSVLDAFTAEYGVRINYQAYESQEEAIENIRSGKVYDMVALDNRFIPSLDTTPSKRGLS